VVESREERKTRVREENRPSAPVTDPNPASWIELDQLTRRDQAEWEAAVAQWDAEFEQLQLRHANLYADKQRRLNESKGEQEVRQIAVSVLAPTDPLRAGLVMQMIQGVEKYQAISSEVLPIHADVPQRPRPSPPEPRPLPVSIRGLGTGPSHASPVVAPRPVVPASTPLERIAHSQATARHTSSGPPGHIHPTGVAPATSATARSSTSAAAAAAQ